MLRYLKIMTPSIQTTTPGSDTVALLDDSSARAARYRLPEQPEPPIKFAPPAVINGQIPSPEGED